MVICLEPGSNDLHMVQLIFHQTTISAFATKLTVVTFRVSRRPREMYCGHARLCVSVCLCVRGRMPTLLHGPGCNLGEW